MTAETFTTDDGRPVPAVTSDEMREVDRIATYEVGLGLLQMMENAGRTLARFAGEPTDAPVVVFAGDGGNRGGGLCAARHLSNHSVDVRVVLDRPSEELTRAAATQYRILRDTDATLAGTAVDATGVDEAGLVADAIVGYGVAGAPRDRVANHVDVCNAADAPVLSPAVPAGVDATTGDRPGVAVDADHVLTLALPKTGLSDHGLWHADIGVPREVYHGVGIDYVQPFSSIADPSPAAGPATESIYKHPVSC
jgi:NAD(P)H-hydrate epimerase